MALPEQIQVRYTEDDAGYVSVRPVVKQVFRMTELADMVVSVAGKDAARVQQIFLNGTLIYNGYRYWWEALTADLNEVQALLAPFPDDDPSRSFEAAKATAVLLEMGGGTQRNIVEIGRQDASARKLFQQRSSWDVLQRYATTHAARYEKYSHARRADLFRISLPYEDARKLLAEMLEAAPRGRRHRWTNLHPPAAITFVCPR